MKKKHSLEITQTLIGDGGFTERKDILGFFVSVICCLLIIALIFLGVMAFIG